MQIDGIIVGLGTFLIIGILHPVVIKAEYYCGKGIWPCFAGLGICSIIGSLFIPNFIMASLVAVLGFSLLWSVHELIEQEERVKKGWYPKNPNKK